MFRVHDTWDAARDRIDDCSARASAAAQLWSLPGRASASAAAAANSRCPLAEPCTRSALQVSGSRIDSAWKRSTSRNPCRCAAVLMTPLIRRTRPLISLPTGRIAAMSGNIVVTTVAPEAANLA
ncbi:hypothetical protein AU196_08435 [Mycobacterium sp. IS-1742]|nr:hypothetical protein AU196_08435 [Mycobacterium sp. IS-1742]